RLEAEERFEALDEQLADWQTRFSEAEMAGEALHERAEAARRELREFERQAQEADYAERALQARRSDLQRTLQLAAEQERRAVAELEGLQGELFELDAAAAQAGLQDALRSEEHTSELQSRENLVCRLLLEKKNRQESVRIV